MYEKNFPLWLKKKARLHALDRTPYFNEREVWWASIGLNIGDEEDGKSANFSRPVLVFRKFNGRFFYGIPLTSKPKLGLYYHTFSLGIGNSTALLSHMRELDARRLIRKMDTVTLPDYEDIQKKMMIIINRPAV